MSWNVIHLKIYYIKFAFIIGKQFGWRRDAVDAESSTVSGEPIWPNCVPRFWNHTIVQLTHTQS